MVRISNKFFAVVVAVAVVGAGIGKNDALERPSDIVDDTPRQIRSSIQGCGTIELHVDELRCSFCLD